MGVVKKVVCLYMAQSGVHRAVGVCAGLYTLKEGAPYIKSAYKLRGQEARTQVKGEGGKGREYEAHDRSSLPATPAASSRACPS